MNDLSRGTVLHDVDKMVIFDSKTGGLSETGPRFAHPAMGATPALMARLPEETVHIIRAHIAKLFPVQQKSIGALILRRLDHVAAQSVHLSRGLDVEKALNRVAARESRVCRSSRR